MLAIAKGIVKDTLSVKCLKEVAIVLGGLTGAVVGEQVVIQKMGKTSTGAKVAGGVVGSLVAGIIAGLITKSRTQGVKAAVSGIAYVTFKLLYSKVLAGRSFAGVTMPAALGDYVTMPGMGDYVTQPRALGQFAYEPPAGPPVEPISMAAIEDEIDW